MLQASHHDLPAWATERPRPSRQYVIGRRRCRQRLAQGLAAGRSPRALAAVNRLGVAEVETLLQDPGFQDLVAHYRTLAELPEAEKLAGLRRKALDLMELALDAGDVRVAIFFAYEELHGRDPAMTLAKAAIRAVEREAARTAPAPGRRPCSRPPAEPKREADFPYCAATQASPVEAAAMAADEARRFETRIATTRRSLTGKLLAEAEREGTAKAEPFTDTAEAFAREAHEQGGRALGAAAQWQARREAFAAGRVAAVGDSDTGPATLVSPCTVVADPPVKPEGDTRVSGAVPTSSSSPGSTGGSASPKQAWSSERSADPPVPVPAEGRHPQSAAARTAAPLQREGPAPPAPLPDWVDLVPGADRARLLAMPEAIRAETLRVWARFYGFDTG